MKLIFGGAGGGAGGVERLPRLFFFYSHDFFIFFWPWMQKRLSLLRSPLTP